MDWDLSNSSVVIVGAGFSAAATNGQVPLMRTFFDQLDRASYEKLYDFTAEFAGDPPTANVEKVLLTLDQIRTSPVAALNGWAEHWKPEYQTIKRQLSEYTLKRLGDCHILRNDNWAGQVLSRCGFETTVISMNYDNIAERILSNREGIIHRGQKVNCPHCKMAQLMRKACSCDSHEEIDATDWRGALLKPHGSIAWKRCLNPSCCSYECLVAHPRCMPFEPCPCPQCNCDCAPVMVMPTMAKNLEEIPEIGIMWFAARQAIEDAESIALIGFSMPDSDDLLIKMIKSAVSRTHRLRRVAAIDLDPSGVLQRFEQCIPTDLEVEATAFEVVPGIIPEWLVCTDSAIKQESRRNQEVQ